MATRRQLLLGLAMTPTLDALAGSDSESDRQIQKLLLGAAEAIATKRYTRAKLFLRTIRNTYPDSSFIPVVDHLLFFAYASENPKLHGGGLILDDIRAVLSEIDAPQASSVNAP